MATVIDHLIGHDQDATVISSGGSTFTVESVSVDSGATTKRTFRGRDAKKRACDEAKKITAKETP